MRFCQNIPAPFWASFCQSLNFLHFSWHRIWLVCRVVTIFPLTQILRPGEHFRYLEHVRQFHRRLARGLWNQNFQLKTWGFVRIFQPYFELNFFLICWAELFSKPSRKFSVGLYEHVRGIWNVRLAFIFASVKKSWPHDIPIRFYVRKSEKSWDFDKMKLKMGLEYSDKTAYFELKLFFKGL